MDNNYNSPPNTTFVDLLKYRAEHQKDKTAYIFLVDGEKQEVKLTYRDLDMQARAIAAELQKKLSPGDRAILLYPPGLEFISGFFGCLYAGIIAVPAYPPDPSNMKKSMDKLKGIISDCEPQIALTTKFVMDLGLSDADPALKQIEWLASDTLEQSLAQNWQQPEITKDDIAFLQYTSGSTGEPKGVMISHGNLMHNLEYIKTGTELTTDDRGLFWLPVYHDMGLINGVINSIYTGITNILMSPISFLQRPIRWLQAISHYRVTYSGGPNFAYDLCVNKIRDKDYVGLDLSTWRCAFSGAETIHKETLNSFADMFKSIGFNYKYFYPCYGLAEATVAVSGSFIDEEPVIIDLNQELLKQNAVIESSENNLNIKRIVGCGHAWPGMKIIIANSDDKTQCPDSHIGEIWVKGESVAKGYWNNPEATEKTFNAYLADADSVGTDQGPFLRTEDLGFIKDGELFVTGRIKDLIIIRGKNHYPQDIELTVEKSHTAFRKGCTAAFSVDIQNEERLVIVQEIKADYINKLDYDEAVKSVKTAVVENHELQVYAIALIKPKTINKTSSGKIQRSECKKNFLNDNLSIIKKEVFKVSKENIQEKSFIIETLNAVKEKDARNSIIIVYLKDAIGRILEIPKSEIDIDKPLIEMNIDSVAGVEIISQIEIDLNITLDISRLFENMTISKLSILLNDKLMTQ